MRRLLGWFLFVTIAAVPHALAQQPRAASVQGAVVKAPAGEAIASATVELRSIDGAGRFYSNTSERDGTFAFRAVPPGRYQLTAMRPGYVRGDFGLRGPGGSGVSITLAAGQRLSDVRLAMRPTGTISGRVTDRTGAPAGNVHVKALRFAYVDGRVSLIDVKSVFTNDLGEYRLGWLPPGIYNVSALHAEALGNPLNIPEVINSATIVGTVVTNAGGMNGGSFGSTGSTDPAVRARLGLQPGDDYVPVYYPGTLDQRSATALEVRSGAELTGIDLIVAPVRTASIAGVVRPLPTSGTPTRLVVAVSRNPNYNFRLTNVNIDPLTGAFQVTGLAPGSYAFVANVGAGDDRLAGAATVDVAEGSAASVEVVVDRGIKVPVSISAENSTPGVDVSVLRVSLRLDPAMPGMADTSAARATDGSIVVPFVLPGDHVVNVAPLMTLSPLGPNPPPAVPGAAMGFGPPPPGGRISTPSSPNPAYVKSMRYGNVDLVDGRLHVDSGSAASTLEIVVATGSGQLDGRVLDAAGKPAPNATVVLVPDASRRSRLDFYKVTATEPGGRFHFANIPDGDYAVFAWEDIETGAWLDPQVLRIDEGRGVRIHVAEGASLTADLSVIPAR